MRRKARWALVRGHCPWCRAPVAGVAGTTCPECGNDWGEAVAPPDPGTPRRARVASVLVVVLIALVALIQQTAESPAARAAGQPPAAAKGLPAPSVQFELVAKIMTRLYLWQRDPAMGSQLMQTLDKEARTPVDQFRAAIVAAEVQGEDRARERLEKLAERDELPRQLRADIETVLDIYAGTADPAAVEGLRQRHGWFGDLASTYGLPMADPDRRDVAGNGGKIFGALMLAAFGIGSVLLAGGILFVVAIILAAMGIIQPRFRPPAPGGSVAAETVAVFIAAFIGLKLVAALVESLTGSPVVATVCAMAMQWSLALVLLWPVVRGVPARLTLELWGLSRGRGILREIGAGLVGYLAVLPLLAVGAVVSVTLMVLYQAIRLMMGLPEPAVPENPIIDILAGKTAPWLIILLMLLASLWAPLVEESVFRGALYRQLRSRWHWFPAALVTALGFGLMHGYPILLLGPVIALGFGFALLREWRGSLIASMTAHCIHNTVVISALLLAMHFLGL